MKAVSVQITDTVMRWENNGKGESKKKSPQFEGWGFPVFRGWGDKEDPAEESEKAATWGRTVCLPPGPEKASWGRK